MTDPSPADIEAARNFADTGANGALPLTDGDVMELAERIAARVRAAVEEEREACEQEVARETTWVMELRTEAESGNGAANVKECNRAIEHLKSVRFAIRARGATDAE